MNLPRLLRDRRHAHLLEAARRGNAKAFRTLYRALVPQVTGYVAARLARREDVEDVVSQVFHRWLEHLDRFDGTRGSVSTWILTMTHHALVDHYRRGRSSVRMDEAVVGPAPADDPLEELIRAERAGMLRGRLDVLAPDTRRMFELRYDRDMSYREIAELLAIGEDAVKQRFSRAHRMLRAALEKEEDFDHA